MKNNWSYEEIKFLQDYYENEGGAYCCEHLDRSYPAIRIKAQHLGLRVQPDIVIRNRRYAQEPKQSYIKMSTNTFLYPTKESAYVLGFLWAEGWFSKMLDKMSCQFVEKDSYDILPIFNTMNDWLVYKIKDKKRQNRIMLVDTNKEVCEFLAEHNYKSYRFTSPDSIIKIMNDFTPYWFRGYFDGDGCFYYNAKHYLRQMSCSSNINQNWEFLTTLFDTLNISYSINRLIKDSGSYSNIRATGREDIRKFGNYIYGETYDGMGLTRKYDKFLEIIR